MKEKRWIHLVNLASAESNNVGRASDDDQYDHQAGPSDPLNIKIDVYGLTNLTG